MPPVRRGLWDYFHIIANIPGLCRASGLESCPGALMKALCYAGIAIACMVAGVPALRAQIPSPSLIAPQQIPRDGTYAAGEKTEFIIDHRGDQVRLRFSGSDEVFYLSSEAAPLGARVLKYDTGDPALRVTGWGGVTLYTPEARTGVPAEYSDVVHNVDPPPVPANDVKRFAAGLAHDLNAGGDLIIGFAADWNILAQSAGTRELVCDAMRDTTYALEQVTTGPARNAIADHLHVVHIVERDRPSAVLRGGVLTVTVAPKIGEAGRPSSLAIAHALHAGF